KGRWMASAGRGRWRGTWTSTHGNGGRQDVGSATASPALEPAAPDAVLDDLVAHGAAAMLDHGEHSRQPLAHALPAHHDDRVGGGAEVADGDLARQHVLEPRLL